MLCVCAKTLAAEKPMQAATIKPLLFIEHPPLFIVTVYQIIELLFTNPPRKEALTGLETQRRLSFHRALPVLHSPDRHGQFI
jgi:hypothetical protein